MDVDKNRVNMDPNLPEDMIKDLMGDEGLRAVMNSATQTTDAENRDKKGSVVVVEVHGSGGDKKLTAGVESTQIVVQEVGPSHPHG